MNENFARLIAHVQGDGLFVFGKRKELVYYNKEKFLIDQFRDDLRAEFKIIAWKPTWHQNKFVTGTAVVSVVKKFLDVSNKKHVPEIIKKLKKAIKREYLAAYFDDEGSAPFFEAFSKKRMRYFINRKVKLYSKYKSFLIDIKTILLEFNVFLYILGPYNGAYKLVITRADNLVDFGKGIDFNLPRKKGEFA